MPQAPHPTLESYYPDEPSRRRFVRSIFDETASHYDWIIGFMSFGSGNWYRKDALTRAGLAEGETVLEVACGTGPVTRAAQQIVGKSGRVVGLDPSLGMIREMTRQAPTNAVLAIAEEIPFADETFGFLTMGYALRHVADLKATMAEYRRVLRPGGQLLILEISRPSSRLHYRFLRFYLKRVVPRIAGIGSRSRKARKLMEYYWDTIESCVPPETILSAMESSGLEEVRCEVVLGMFSEYRGVCPG